MKCLKITLLLGLLLLVTATCQTRGQDLSFETILQRDIINYEEEKPELFVIAKNDEVDALVPTVLAEDPTLTDELRKLDYSRFFAILVLQGLKGQGGHSVTVQRIVRQNDQVNVYAEFTNPEPGTRRIQAFTSPYHLITVSKQSEWGQQMDFVLVVDSEEVAETSLFIP